MLGQSVMKGKHLVANRAEVGLRAEEGSNHGGNMVAMYLTITIR